MHPHASANNRFRTANVTSSPELGGGTLGIGGIPYGFGRPGGGGGAGGGGGGGFAPGLFIQGGRSCGPGMGRFSLGTWVPGGSVPEARRAGTGGPVFLTSGGS